METIYTTESGMEYKHDRNYMVFIKNNCFNDFDLLGMRIQDLDDKNTRVSFVVNERTTKYNKKFNEINKDFGIQRDKTEYVFYIEDMDFLFDYDQQSIIDKFINTYNEKIEEKDVFDPENYICPF